MRPICTVRSEWEAIAPGSRSAATTSTASPSTRTRQGADPRAVPRLRRSGREEARPIRPAARRVFHIKEGREHCHAGAVSCGGAPDQSGADCGEDDGAGGVPRARHRHHADPGEGAALPGTCNDWVRSLFVRPSSCRRSAGRRIVSGKGTAAGGRRRAKLKALAAIEKRELQSLDVERVREQRIKDQDGHEHMPALTLELKRRGAARRCAKRRTATTTRRRARGAAGAGRWSA